MKKFRFENLEIWQRAVEITRKLFRLADILEQKKLHRFADQLRGAGISMPNNIAEGSGSTSKKEFAQFLNIARRSTFENASMVLVFAKDNLISEDMKNEIVQVSPVPLRLTKSEIYSSLLALSSQLSL